MRKLQPILALLLLAALLGAFANWRTSGSSGHYLADLRSSLVHEEGPLDARANLLVVRPELFPSDYRTPGHLHLKLAAILDKARDSGMLDEHSVVALPDQIGTWLLLAGERTDLFSARRFDEVQTRMALSSPVRLATTWLRSEGSPGIGETLLRMKADKTARSYQQVFGTLAREYGITLLAGSVLLPEPRLVNGELRTHRGPLYNFTLVFGPDGSPIGALRLQPCAATAGAGSLVQEVRTNDMELQVSRTGCEPSIKAGDMQTGVPLLLRGRLWSLEGLANCCEGAAPPTALAKGEPGSHLLNFRIPSRQIDSSTPSNR